jgi:phosphate transport system permease protein
MSETAAPRFRPHRRIRSLLGPIFGTACFLATVTGLVVLVVLLGAILYAALQGKPDNPWYAIGANLRELWALVGTVAQNRQSSSPATAGYRVGIVGSLWLLGLVGAVAIPMGVAAGVYLEEYAPQGRLRRIIQTNISNLAGVPSIVYGILGLALFVRAFGVKSLALGPCLMAGALTLSLLILPIIVITTQEALRTVPGSLRQAALALGATRWQMVAGHLLPSALPGIMTGTILGLSRAIGETAPLLMVGAAGAIRRLPRGPLDRYTAIPVEIYNYAKEPDRMFQTISAGGILILLMLLLSMNAAAIIIRNRFQHHH